MHRLLHSCAGLTGSLWPGRQARPAVRRRRRDARPLAVQQLEPKIALAADSAALAFAPGLIADINPGGSASYPSLLTAVGSTLFFTANDGVNGTELWKSDGTAAGTVRVKNIRGGSQGSYPYSLTAVGSTIYFTADDGVSGRELWKSDGTEAGTVRVKNIHTGRQGAYPYNLTAVGTTLYFTATDSRGDRELWKSDGTDAGTNRVKNIWVGLGFSSAPRSLTPVGSTLYFLANDGPGSRKLWKTDGTQGGTVRVNALRRQGGNTYVGGYASLTAVSSTLYFTADDGVAGRELWKTDGTTAGSARVTDIRAGIFGPAPSYLTAVGSTLYFTADDGTSGRELWKTDGTDDGTVRVKDINTGGGSAFSDYLNHLKPLGSTLYFAADDGTNGTELWKTDGTEGGTVRVKDIQPGRFGSSPNSFTAVGSTLYFTAEDRTVGRGLWRTDGTEAGTTRVTAIPAGGFTPRSLTLAGSTLYMAANDAVSGEELWAVPASDGTSGPTNQPPTDISLSTASVAGNAPAGAIIGTFTATDPDVGDTLTYALVAGEGDADNAAFLIDRRDLKLATALSVDLRPTCSVRVRATDAGGLTTEKAFTITVTDVADEPLVVESVAPPAPGAYGVGQRVRFTVTLSEVVQVRGKPQIQVRAGTATKTASYVSGSGSSVLTFEYVVGKRTNADSVALGQKFIFARRSSITAGTEKLTAMLPAGIAGAAAEGARIDTAAPRPLGTVGVPDSGTYTEGQSLDFVVRFSEAVFVETVPVIAVTGLNGARYAIYESGSGTQELTFRYVVEPGDALRGRRGLGLAKSIVLPYGRGDDAPTPITDEAGNRAVLRIKAPAMKGIRINTTPVEAAFAAAGLEAAATPKRSTKTRAFAEI